MGFPPSNLFCQFDDSRGSVLLSVTYVVDSQELLEIIFMQLPDFLFHTGNSGIVVGQLLFEDHDVTQGF